MKIDNCIKCEKFPCTDVTPERYTVPDIEIDPSVTILMISEAPPPTPGDYFYAAGDPFYLKTTIQAFNQAGLPVSCLKDILAHHIYITTAIKCGKTKYSICANTIKNCSELLEKEMNLFSQTKVLLLMQ